MLHVQTSRAFSASLVLLLKARCFPCLSTRKLRNGRERVRMKSRPQPVSRFHRLTFRGATFVPDLSSKKWKWNCAPGCNATEKTLTNRSHSAITSLQPVQTADCDLGEWTSILAFKLGGTLGEKDQLTRRAPDEKKTNFLRGKKVRKRLVNRFVKVTFCATCRTFYGRCKFFIPLNLRN